MGDIIELHERILRLEIAHDSLVNLLQDKGVIPKEVDKDDKKT